MIECKQYQSNEQAHNQIRVVVEGSATDGSYRKHHGVSKKL